MDIDVIDRKVRDLLIANQQLTAMLGELQEFRARVEPMLVAYEAHKASQVDAEPVAKESEPAHEGEEQADEHGTSEPEPEHSAADLPPVAADQTTESEKAP